MASVGAPPGRMAEINMVGMTRRKKPAPKSGILEDLN